MLLRNIMLAAPNSSSELHLTAFYRWFESIFARSNEAQSSCDIYSYGASCYFNVDILYLHSGAVLYDLACFFTAFRGASRNFRGAASLFNLITHLTQNLDHATEFASL
jgi:hypothetical protein